MFKILQTIQVKTLKIITNDFKTTLIQTLNIKINVFLIKQRLKKHTCNIVLKITIISTYDKIVKKKSKRRNKQLISLKILLVRYEKKSNLKIKNMKKIVKNDNIKQR